MSPNLSFSKSLLILAVVVMLGGFFRLYDLGKQSFIADEYLGVNIGYGYHKSGQWKFWDFNQDKLSDESYTRSKIYYWQVAKIFSFLPVSETSARLVSVMWGLFGIVVVYLVSYLFFKKPWLSLIAATLIAISISALMFDRKLRMYSMFAPVYFIFSFFVYKFLESKESLKVKFIDNINSLTQLNWYYFPLVLLFGLISIATHLLTVNIFPVVFCYFLVLLAFAFIKKKEYLNKYLAFTLLSVAGFFALSQISLIKGALYFFTLFQDNYGYLEKVTLDYDHNLLAVSFFVIGSYCLIKNYGKIALWIVLSFLVPLVLAIFVWDRSAGDQYIYFTEPFKAVVAGAGIYYTAKWFYEKIEFNRKFLPKYAVIVVFLLFCAVNISFFSSKSSYFQDPQKWDYPNYKQVFRYYLKHKQDDALLITRKLTFFYIWGSHSKVLTYGPTDPVTLDEVKKAQQENNQIWFIASKDTYIRKDASDYIENNFKSVETTYTNNDIKIWIWDKVSQPPTEENK